MENQNNEKDLRDGIQQFMGESYEAACCALCCVDIAVQFRKDHPELYSNAHIDVLDAFYKACDKGYIYYNRNDLNDSNNFFVQYPALFLEQMTGRKWEYRKETATYQCKSGEYAMQRYERQKTGQTIGHFQRETFQPIINSLTVQYGVLISQRVLKVLNA